MSQQLHTHFYCRRVAKLLAPIMTPPPGVDASVEVVILTRTKDEEENKRLFQQILAAIGSVNLFLSFSHCCLSTELTDVHVTQESVGTLPKDKMVGKFVTEWNAITSASGTKLEEVDVAAGVASLLAVKDEQELVRSFLVRQR